jgi:phosphoribosylamine-glycine ligase
LVVSKHGTSLFLARRLAAEGHRVRFHVSEAPYWVRAVGLVDRARDLAPERGEIIIIDECGFAEQARTWRRRGYPVVGGNPAEQWEEDRAIGADLMDQCGLLTPETHTFPNVDRALSFLQSPDGEGEWFFKADDAPAHLTRNAKSAAMMRRFLVWAAWQLKGNPKFLLQRKVHGTEVDIDVWTNGRAVTLPHEIDLEEKYAQAGNIGPRTGCQSNVLFDCEDRIVAQTIGCFEDALIDSKYVGVSALNCIVTPTGAIYGLEFSNRLGYDATQAWLARIPGDVGEQLAEFAAGTLDAWETYPDRPFALTLKLSVPPAPLDDDGAAREFRGAPLDNSLLDDTADVVFYPEDVALDPQGDLIFAGTEGNLGCLAAVGPSLPVLRQLVVERARSFDIDNLQFRHDPVSTAEDRLDALARLGLIERRPTFKGTAHDFEEERAKLEIDGRHHYPGPSMRPSDVGSHGQSLPDSAPGGIIADMQEPGAGGMSSGPASDDAAPASSDAGSVGTP